MTVCVEYPPGSVKSGSCVKCGRTTPCRTEPGMPRNVEFERRVVRVAHQAAGVAVPRMEDGEPTPPTRLDWFAEGRASPGNVDTEDRDLLVDGLEELADARNYFAWEAQIQHAGYMRGDSEASSRYAMCLRALQGVAFAYDAATVPPT